MEKVDKKLVEKLKKEQLKLSKKLNLQDRIPVDEIRTVAGIDVTFTDIRSPITTGIACITVLDLKDGFRTVDTVFAEKTVEFPYVPTFLAYRELPVIMEAYEKLKVKPDAFIVDGMGILHPRKMGIASHFGVLTDTVCVGCGKSKLVGDYQMPENEKFAHSPVFVDGEKRGYVVRTRRNANPVFISPGNNISVDGSLELLKKTTTDYKLPEPTRRAHLLLQRYRKAFLKGKNKRTNR
ncbi:MAG: endonuclease V [Aquificae bacterium]|nr:endonuclease V [Aquificota bacterium]